MDDQDKKPYNQYSQEQKHNRKCQRLQCIVHMELFFGKDKMLGQKICIVF